MADHKTSREVVTTFLSLLQNRRSRRFGLGMKMPEGPLAFESKANAIPLSEEEEALLAFAACGVTGYALGDLAYQPGGGGTMMVGFLGRTIPSGDAIHASSMFIMNREATYYMKRPQDFKPAEYRELIELGRAGEYVELYRRSRVKIRDGRPFPSNSVPFNLNINKWSLYDPNATYFLPVNELTHMYINGLLEAFNETSRYFIIDERAGFRPAGIGRYARSKGGYLEDDPKLNFITTVEKFESVIAEFVMVEQAMMVQNLSMMSQALGIGGYPHWAAHPLAWFESLNFNMIKMKSSQFLAMNWPQKIISGILGFDEEVPFATSFEINGMKILKPFCPPNYKSMEDAVNEVVEKKFGLSGIFRSRINESLWKNPDSIANTAKSHSEDNINATISYCEYLYNRYGRFPVYQTPFSTGLGFQANHVDLDFYREKYADHAIHEFHHNHMQDWHSKDG